MYKLSDDKAELELIESKMFKDVGINESQIEEIIELNANILSEDDEEGLLIIGKQVVNNKNGRSDLVAIDQNGSIVVIEIKRDIDDIKHRKERFESQAIRYVSSFMLLTDINEVIEEIYVPYLIRKKQFFNKKLEEVKEFAETKINDFLDKNNASSNFNNQQRIILIASEFDEQTLSSVTWLNNNGVNISCYEIKPYIIEEKKYLNIKKILPLKAFNDYVVGFKKPKFKNYDSPDIIRRNLPKIKDMLEWGVIKAGQVIKAKDYPDEAILLKNGRVKLNEKESSLQQWLREVYGWSSVQTYNFCVLKETNETLAEIRKKYMEENDV